MYKKSLFIILLLSAFIYATEKNNSINSIKTEQNISIETNTTTVENNTSNKINTPVVKKERKFQAKQLAPKKQNFNMTKGDSKRGEAIFKKNLKKSCQISSYKFTTSYSQDEWEEIAESGSFREIVFKLCINIRKIYQDTWSPDLYQFAYEHANDS